MKRLLDFSLALFLIIIFIGPILFLFLFNFILPNLKIIHWSRRIGKNNAEFLMPKIRTMEIGTPNVATDLLDDPDRHITKIGSILRKYSIDEIPQIWSILRGEMSFVGPRPALYNQYSLIKLRNLNGIDNLKPGLTGWAQINGRDDISIEKKVQLEQEYLYKRSTLFDIEIIIKTFTNVLFSKGVSH